MPDLPPLVAAMLDPATYPPDERPGKVEFDQTHVSWLFFTGRYVYKVKKPLDLGFLDFTTLEKRRFYCHEELRLNRRLSPEVYIGVAGIYETRGRYAVGEESAGKAVEYAVKMRQLPKDRWLSNLLEARRVTDATIRTIARRIADFHRDAETSDGITAKGSLETVRFNIFENFSQSERYIGKTIDAACFDVAYAYSAGFLLAREALFRRREREGRIRDGHGDLHAANVSVQNGIDFIDCIEFNERFRCGDVAADLAFLAMDLDYHARKDFTRSLVQEYMARSGDVEAASLLDFYKCYRAFARGKVLSILYEQAAAGSAQRGTSQGGARRYFELGRSYAAIPGRVLIAMSGVMGSGKSTLAREIASRVDARVFRSDVVRKEIAPVPPRGSTADDWEKGIYAPEFSERTYEELHRMAADALSTSTVVILDASYRRASWRSAARDVARLAGAAFILLETACREPILTERLRGRRGDVSDGRVELLDAQRQAFEPVTDMPGEEHVVVDNAVSLTEATRTALTQIYARLLVA
jgi:aminoglycoside phosphotransferase family enzyme/predicted kinase